MNQHIGYLYDTGRWITPPIHDYPTGGVPRDPRRGRRGSRLRRVPPEAVAVTAVTAVTATRAGAAPRDEALVPTSPAAADPLPAMLAAWSRWADLRAAGAPLVDRLAAWGRLQDARRGR